MSIFPCSLTRNITTRSMENLAFHSLLRWKMVILPILANSPMYFLFKMLGECAFWACNRYESPLRTEDAVQYTSGINAPLTQYPTLSGSALTPSLLASSRRVNMICSCVGQLSEKHALTWEVKKKRWLNSVFVVNWGNFLILRPRADYFRNAAVDVGRVSLRDRHWNFRFRNSTDLLSITPVFGHR